MDHIAVDLAGPISISNESKYVLIAVDVFSRFIWLRPLNSKSETEVAFSLFSIFCEFGHPKIIQSDSGGEFINDLLEHISLLYGFDHRKTTPYHPQGNGIAERAVHSAKELIKKRILGGGDNIYSVLLTVQLGINARINSLHESSPFSIMFSRALNAFKSYSNEEQAVPSSSDIEQRCLFIRNIIFPAIHDKANSTIQLRNNQWNSKYNVNTNFVPGSMVMIIVPYFQAKLNPPYIGPFKVLKKLR